MSYTIDKPERLRKLRDKWEKDGRVKLAVINERGSVVTVVRWPTGNVRVYHYHMYTGTWRASIASDTVGIPKSLPWLAVSLGARLLED